MKKVIFLFAVAAFLFAGFNSTSAKLVKSSKQSTVSVAGDSFNFDGKCPHCGKEKCDGSCEQGKKAKCAKDTIKKSDCSKSCKAKKSCSDKKNDKKK